MTTMPSAALLMPPGAALLRFAASATPEDGLPQELLSHIRGLFGASSGLRLEQPASGGWRACGKVDGTTELLSVNSQLVEAAATEAVAHTTFLLRGGPAGPGRALLCVSLGMTELGHSVLAMLVVDSPDLPRCVATAGPLIQLVVQSAMLRRETATAALTHERLSGILETLERMTRSADFQAAAQFLVDDVAGRTKAQQVALCWRGGETRLKAISHMDFIPRRTELARQIEDAAEDAMLQGQELLWPAPPGQGAVTTAIGHYAQSSAAAHIAIIPLGRPGDFRAALVIETAGPALQQKELWLLRVLADHAFPPLLHLQQASQMLPRRLGRELLRTGSLPRPGAMRRLALAGLAAALLLGVSFITLPHRLSAPFILRTDRLALVSAPFDGFIESVAVRVGEPVTAGQVLFRMKTRELQLERAALLADIAQHEREAQKHQAANVGSDMRIALAQMEQSRARLQQTEFRIAAAAVRAPIAGFVVEGELPQQIGAALRRGEPGFRIAAQEAFYAEVNMQEADIAFVRPAMAGEIAFVGRPQAAFDIEVLRVVPQASVQNGENTIAVRSQPLPGEDWWRPGMTGIARLDVGSRPIWWLASRKLVDFLRLHVWW